MQENLAATFSVIKSALDLVGSLKDYFKKPEISEHEVTEMKGTVFQLWDNLITVKSDYSELCDINRELKQQIAEYSNWDKEASRYELCEWVPGIFAYRIKEDCRSSEPVHYLCPACISNRKKSIMSKQEVDGWYYKCPSCEWEVRTESPSNAKVCLPDGFENF